MNGAQQSHPSSAELQQFALGRLKPERQTEIERHVAQCDLCCQVLRDVPEDTLLGKLRGGATDVDIPALNSAPAFSELHGFPEELSDHPRYRIVNRLGRGGMGDVYQAEHRLMERRVALKVISKRFLAHPLAIERFRREYKAAAKLSHPNIVTAHDADHAGSLHFLVMEYVDGVSLDRLVAKNGPLPVTGACTFIQQAALGLHHAHQHNMIHRDIKPHNLMLTKTGVVKILDFGLARTAVETADSIDSSDSLTMVGSVLGTPDYIAPEQARDSHTADVRSDVYSLGCTFYFLLTGKPPFPDLTSMQKLIAHREDEPQSVTENRSDLPAELCAVLNRMMAKHPDKRYQTASEVAQALTPFSNVSERAPKSAAAEKTTVAPQAPVGRRRRLWLASIGIVLVLGMIVWWIVHNANQPDKTSRHVSPAIVPKTGNVVMIVPSQSIWYMDYGPIRKELEDAGLKVHVASTKRARINADGPGDDKAIGVSRSVTPDMLVSDVTPSDFDALVWVGTQDRMEYVKDEQMAKLAETVTRAFLNNKKFVASVCRGTEVLGYNGFLNGKRIPGGKYHPDDAKQKWKYAEIVDEPYTLNGKLLIGRDDTDSAAVGKRLAELTTGKSGS